MHSTSLLFSEAGTSKFIWFFSIVNIQFSTIYLHLTLAPAHSPPYYDKLKLLQYFVYTKN